MYYLGIDVGGMSVKVGIVDEEGQHLLKDKFETRRDRSYEEIIRDIGEFSVKMIEKSESAWKTLKACRYRYSRNAGL